jgi:hypothetical protein
VSTIACAEITDFKLTNTELITIFDGYKYIGTMQICIARMLKESGIFFAVSESPHSGMLVTHEE